MGSGVLEVRDGPQSKFCGQSDSSLREDTALKNAIPLALLSKREGCGILSAKLIKFGDL